MLFNQHIGIWSGFAGSGECREQIKCKPWKWDRPSRVKQCSLLYPRPTHRGPHTRRLSPCRLLLLGRSLHIQNVTFQVQRAQKTTQLQRIKFYRPIHPFYSTRICSCACKSQLSILIGNLITFPRLHYPPHLFSGPACVFCQGSLLWDTDICNIKPIYRRAGYRGSINPGLDTLWHVGARHI